MAYGCHLLSAVGRMIHQQFKHQSSCKLVSADSPCPSRSPPFFPSCSFTIEHVTSPPAAQLSEGAISPAQYASATRQQRGAVFQGYMQAQLARSRGREEAERMVGAMYDEYERRLEAAPPPGEGLTMVYLLLQRV